MYSANEMCDFVDYVVLFGSGLSVPARCVAGIVFIFLLLLFRFDSHIVPLLSFSYKSSGHSVQRFVLTFSPALCVGCVLLSVRVCVCVSVIAHIHALVKNVYQLKVIG